MTDSLVNLMLENLSVLIRTRAVFVFVALLENTKFSAKVLVGLTLGCQTNQGSEGIQRVTGFF